VQHGQQAVKSMASVTGHSQSSRRHAVEGWGPQTVSQAGPAIILEAHRLTGPVLLDMNAAQT